MKKHSQSGRVGLFIGRFQPLHNGHLHAIKSISRQVDLLWIGIGSINKTRSAHDPFTFRERVWMIHTVLQQANIKNYRLFGVRDHTQDSAWVRAIKRKIGRIDIVFTGNPWTNRCFIQQEYRVKTIQLFEQISATKIRDALQHNHSWTQMVPPSLHSWLNCHT